MEKNLTIVQAILKTQTSIRQSIQRTLKANKVSITFEMLQIMVRLWRQDGVKQQELADKTFKDKASLTYLINNLEKRGLVVRAKDAADRRNKLINLTQNGASMRDFVMPLIDKIYIEAATITDKKHIEKCIIYLQEVNDAFKKI